MKEWERIARQIYVGDLPISLYNYLDRISMLTERAHGEFRSRQIIAVAIATFEVLNTKMAPEKVEVSDKSWTW